MASTDSVLWPWPFEGRDEHGDPLLFNHYAVEIWLSGYSLTTNSNVWISVMHGCHYGMRKYECKRLIELAIFVTRSTCFWRSSRSWLKQYLTVLNMIFSVALRIYFSYNSSMGLALWMQYSNCMYMLDKGLYRLKCYITLCATMIWINLTNELILWNILRAEVRTHHHLYN